MATTGLNLFKHSEFMREIQFDQEWLSHVLLWKTSLIIIRSFLTSEKIKVLNKLKFSLSNGLSVLWSNSIN